MGKILLVASALSLSGCRDVATNRSAWAALVTVLVIAGVWTIVDRVRRDRNRFAPLDGAHRAPGAFCTACKARFPRGETAGHQCPKCGEDMLITVFIGAAKRPAPADDLVDSPSMRFRSSVDSPTVCRFPDCGAADAEARGPVGQQDRGPRWHPRQDSNLRPPV